MFPLLVSLHTDDGTLGCIRPRAVKRVAVARSWTAISAPTMTQAARMPIVMKIVEVMPCDSVLETFETGLVPPVLSLVSSFDALDNDESLMNAK
ncbi:hypothetical protein PsorP6_012099 [Peronosclerospora sorghi]|uniref:Uncharacterized protein n=1 Tax=Peronosclerospora sorghi TaxID=230839 RepID=A0ACC0WHR9_9STRA|nr:hypothetical protein PsorP6_012099 [Peronosclerospora sorghi]